MGDACASLSLPHRLWRWLPERGRRRIALQAATLAAPRIALPPPPVRDGIIVAGELSRASGLGEGARLMLHALRQLRVPCWPLDVGPLLPAHRADVAPPATGEPPDGAALVLHVNAPMLPLVLARLPRAMSRRRRVIGYWAWELPVSPPDWRVGARFVHEAWVPSQFTAAAIEPLLPGRVRVVPHPVAASPPATSPPALAPLDRAAFGLPADAVVVLVSANLASSFARKDPLAAIATFRAAFGDRADRVLVLKLGNPDHFATDYAAVTAAVAGAPNIRLETRSLPAAEAHALTAAADIVLALHRSEGFGLVLAEAMLLGKPVVATGWSGNMEFMNAENAMPVPYRLVPVSDPRLVYQVAGAVWAEPDRAQAARMLRRLADDPALRAAIGKRARSDAERLGSGPLEAAVHTLGLRPRAA